MDEGVTGLLGIECQHTSGCHCLNKWGENSCVVCRSCQKPVLEGRNRHFDHQKYIKHDQCECFECGYFDNLWICMICGHIGCGRYQEAHAYDHYLETNHVFTLEIETQTVWDYFGDGYVHRLIQNTIDGALDELPSSSSKMVRHSGQEQNRQSSTSNDANGGDQAKIDHISVEYTYMLTTQLDSQRLYYEEQSDILTEQLSVLTAEMDNLAVENVQAKEEHLQLVNENHRIESYKADLVKYTERLDKRIISYKDKHQSIEKNLNEERLVIYIYIYIYTTQLCLYTNCNKMVHSLQNPY
jgi:BRCA1-associated protein